MISKDLKGAYYQASIHPENRKYLRSDAQDMVF